MTIVVTDELKKAVADYVSRQGRVASLDERLPVEEAGVFSPGVSGEGTFESAPASEIVVTDELKRAVADYVSKEGGKPSAKPAEGFSWPRAIIEATGKGIFSLPDLIQAISYGGVEGARESMLGARKAAAENLGVDRKGDISSAWREPIAPHWKPSDIVPKTQVPETAAQRIGMKAAEMAGASAIPIGGMAGLAKNVALGAGMGAGSGALQEAGAPPLAADIAALGAGLMVPRMIGKAFSPNALTAEEEKVAETLQNFVGNKEIPATSRNLSQYLEGNHGYSHLPSYEPMTAEVANNPSISQIHRARLGIPGSGLQDKAARQNEALMSKMEEHSLKASPSSEIKENVGRELKKRESRRREATKEGYESVEKMKKEVPTTHIMKFLEEKPAAGTIKKDLNGIRKELMPKTKSSKVDFEYQKLYENASKSTRNKMAPPSGSEAKVSKLAAIDSDLTAKIEKLTKSGQKKRATILRQAQEALRKDLDTVNVYREARSQYAELSKPVSEILEHPTLKKLPKHKANTVMNDLYNKNSEDNLMQLRKVIGKNPEQWEGIQHATTEHLKKRIMNAQAEGRSHALSYPKMKRFMELHEGALREVYTKEQMAVIKSIETALKGQNTAKTLGQGVGSDTQAKQAIDKMLSKGMGIKGLEFASKGARHIPLVGKSVSSTLIGGLEFIAERSEKRLVDVLDKALREPEFAHKLLSHTFKSPDDVKKFVNNALVSTSIVSRNRKKEDS